MTVDRINVIQVGLGPIGLAIATQVVRRRGLRLVGAVDTAPGLAGRSLGDLVRCAPAEEIVVASEGARLLAMHEPGVVVLASLSRLKDVVKHVSAIAAAGWNVVSTAEELSNPWSVDRAAAQSIHELAAANLVSVLGTGINPGFMMDTLPLVLTALCRRVDSVCVRRVVDTNQRRAQLQRKVGVGTSPEEFSHLAASASIGHVGLAQSAASIADRLGWSPFSYREVIQPVVAEGETETGLGVVQSGGVIGQMQHAEVVYEGRTVIELDLEMSAAARPLDTIAIKGDPPITQSIENGVNGDIGTEAIVVNSVKPLFFAPPGLLTMPDLMPLAFNVS